VVGDARGDEGAQLRLGPVDQSRGDLLEPRDLFGRVIGPQREQIDQNAQDHRPRAGIFGRTQRRQPLEAREKSGVMEFR
jgi:hypothetical protein